MSDETKISGTVETCLPLETFPSGFSKRVLVINTGGKYPQTIPVEFAKDKAELLSGLRKGQEITAHVNLRGNEHNGKYYASIQGWKLDKGEVQSGEDRQKMRGSEPHQAKPPSNDTGWNGDQDDVPF
jgi:hypothetical protein